MVKKTRYTATSCAGSSIREILDCLENEPIGQEIRKYGKVEYATSCSTPTLIEIVEEADYKLKLSNNE